MNLLVSFPICAVLSYLIGAIPTAYIFGKWLKGVDIRQHGSGNVGATNAFRVLGKGPGIIVLVIDILKGVLVTAVIPNIFELTAPVWLVLWGAIAVCGHNWTIFLNFKGGKGIATSLGVLIGLTVQLVSLRPVVLLTVGIWLLIFLSTRFVSLASIIAALALPLLTMLFPQPIVVVILTIVLCIFVVLRHQSNIQRLIDGKESRVRLPFFNK